jgi:hypothetical protein
MNFADYDLTEDESMGISESEVLPSDAMVQGSTGLTRSWDQPVPPPALAAVPDAPQRQLGSFGNNGPTNPKGEEKGNGRRSVTSRGLVTTLGDLGKHSNSDSDSEGQEYYTGGGKR